VSENAGAVTGGQQRSLMRIHLIESGDGIEDHLDRGFIALPVVNRARRC
jgi:hypothetical protein